MVDAVSQEQLARLPKWAQRRITLLEMKLSEAEQRITELSPDGDRDSGIEVQRLDASLPLLAGDHIRFQLNRLDPDAWIEARRNDRQEVEVMGGRSILVLPQSSNWVRLRTLTFLEYTGESRG